MLLLIDNYDSFVHNLGRYLNELGQQTVVVRNTDISVREIEGIRPDAIVLSPGPCDPQRAGICVPLVHALSGVIPILGVCLGHQAIAAAFGARIVRSGRPRHGVASNVYHDGSVLFDGLENPFTGARYHSLVVEAGSLPATLPVTAVTHDPEGDTVMGLAHVEHCTVGVQFHPESVLTGCGHQLLANFLQLAGLRVSEDLRREPAASLAEVP